MKRKLVSLALALVPVLGLAPTAPLAAYTEVAPCKYDEAWDFSESLARVKLNDKCGFIDATGREVVPCRYDEARYFSQGLVTVQLNGKWGLIDTTGQEVTPCKYDVARDFSQGLVAVQLNGKWGFIDTTGREVVPCKYDETWDPSQGLARVKLNGKWGFIDTAGREVVPFKYDSARGFSGGLARVELDGKYGYIDATGQEVAPCKYDSASFFSGGLAQVELNGKWGYIDATGREVVPCKYDVARDFSQGLARVELDGKWGFISLSTAAPMAQPSAQTVDVDGKAVEFAMYALKDANGNPTNYIRVRDLAAVLSGTGAQFEVGWDGKVALIPGTAYTGSADKAPFDWEMSCSGYTAPTLVGGEEQYLEAIQIEYDGGGYTYYKLRDLGAALGFNVSWSADKGVFIETDKPYNAND